VLTEDLRIRAETPLGASERVVLGFFAQPEGDGIYRLSRARVLDSIAKGRNLDSLREFLIRGLGSPVPSVLVEFLDDCMTRGRSLWPKGTARLYECRDREIAALVAGHPRTSPYCRGLSETLLVVPIEHEESFRRGVREAGFGIYEVHRRSAE
jgi:hypothetical protein